MKREERQRKILAQLDRETGISAGALAARFQVSRMTIHRDLQSLFMRQLVQRIHGGAVVLRTTPAAGGGCCPACDRPVLPHQRVELLSPPASGSSFACCASCGLRQMLTRRPAEELLVGDQLSGRLLPAREAYYLINSLASPCCQPSVLSFASEEEVALFQSGFGGSIARLDEAQVFLRVAQELRSGEPDS